MQMFFLVFPNSIDRVIALSSTEYGYCDEIPRETREEGK